MNLEDEDYDDTVSKDECVYEDYIPRPGAVASINSPQQAPISRPQGKGICSACDCIILYVTVHAEMGHKSILRYGLRRHSRQYFTKNFVF